MKKFKYSISLVIVVITMICVLIVSSHKNDQEIRIGYFAPMTGPAQVSSEQMIHAFKLANKFNSKLDDGRSIEVLYEDDACDPKKALSSAKKLFEIDRVHILISGVCGGSVVSVAPYAVQNDLILFTPVAATPKITDLGDNVFRISGSGYAITKMASDNIKKMGYKRIGILFENSEYSFGWKESFKNFYTDNQHTIVSEEGFGSKDTDMKTQIMKVMSFKPDLILISPNSTITANILANQIHELNVKTQILGNEYFMFRKVRENVNVQGYFVSSYDFDTSRKEVRDLMDKYKSEFGVYPDDEIYVALSYDGYNVIHNAFNNCPKLNTECLKKYLYNIKDYKGVSGNITIDKNGDGIRDFVLKRIKDGNLINIDSESR